MKRLCFLVVFLSFITSIFSQKYTSGANLPYINPTPGEITIMASSPIPTGLEPTRQMFQDVEDCGFNLTTLNGSVAYIKNIFSLVADLKLKYLISNPQFINQNTRHSYISSLKGNKHLGGWLLKDEPSYDTWDNLSKQYKAFCKEDPNHIVYVNLVGIIHKTFTGPAKTIPEYIESFQKLFTPSLFSYDYYPIITKNGKTTIQYDQFYSDLEDFSSISKKCQRPFWSFCECMAYTTKTYSRPAATEAYLKFQAFNALAYGAQGIVYWAYSLRKPMGGENYTSALVDLKGKKSKAWYAAQKVNNEIKRFNQVFYQCDVKEVKHTGDKLYKGTKKLTGSIGSFKIVRSGSAGVVISYIENKGEKYTVFINRDVYNSQNVRLQLKTDSKVQNLNNNNQYSPDSEIVLTLDKADWAIFKEI